MKNKLVLIMTPFILLCFLNKSLAQAPNLGTASSFALFASDGAFGNVGATSVTGDIGTNSGAFTGFPPGTLVGKTEIVNAFTTQVAIAVDTAYNQLSRTNYDFVIGTTLGNGQVLTPGVYYQVAASILSGDLTLDGQGNPDALFIIKIGGALFTGINSKVIMTNSASLCNVYWQINGKFMLGKSSVFRGTVVVNGAIDLQESSTLIGRALSIAGAISLNKNIVTVGIQPVASIIKAGSTITLCAGDSVILSGNIGGVWSNKEETPSITIKTSGDYFVTNSTCCDSIISNHIIVSESLPIELLNFMVYAVGDNVQLNWSTASEINNDYYTVSRSNDGINFEEVLKINGAGNSHEVLNYSIIDDNPFHGTSYYRLLQTDFDGKFTYSEIESIDLKNSVDITIYPNPFNTYTTIMINDALQINKYELRIYNYLGEEVLNKLVSDQLTTIETNNLPSGVYSYKVISNDKTIQSGKLISQQ